MIFSEVALTLMAMFTLLKSIREVIQELQKAHSDINFIKDSGHSFYKNAADLVQQFYQFISNQYSMKPVSSDPITAINVHPASEEIQAHEDKAGCSYQKYNGPKLKMD